MCIRDRPNPSDNVHVPLKVRFKDCNKSLSHVNKIILFGDWGPLNVLTDLAIYMSYKTVKWKICSDQYVSRMYNFYKFC